LQFADKSAAASLQFADKSAAASLQFADKSAAASLQFADKSAAASLQFADKSAAASLQMLLVGAVHSSQLLRSNLGLLTGAVPKSGPPLPPPPPHTRTHTQTKKREWALGVGYCGGYGFPSAHLDFVDWCCCFILLCLYSNIQLGVSDARRQLAIQPSVLSVPCWCSRIAVHWPPVPTVKIKTPHVKRQPV
jgi:hypothetical protein